MPNSDHHTNSFEMEPPRSPTVPLPFHSLPLSSDQLYKPLDFVSPSSLFLFPPTMASTRKTKTVASAPMDIDIDTRFYVLPSPSAFWSAFNHAGCRLFINVLRSLSANETIPGNIASNAMNIGIRHVVRITSHSYSFFTNHPSSLAFSLRSARLCQPS